MSEDALRDLLHLSEARYRAEEAKLQEVLAQESSLRTAIADLEDRHFRAAEALAQESLAQRAMGGDVLWQGWLARSRRDLQMQLAQVLARKGAMMRELAKAHGRKTASETLLKDATAARRGALVKAQNEAIQSLFMLKNGSGLGDT